MGIQAGKAIHVGPQNTLAISYAAQPIAITVKALTLLTRSLMKSLVRCNAFVIHI